ncbi:MAG: hypothetical protein HYY24_16300 [Verrucomicrobia bacterium]|nr:hypothetical protein [Verrucomicrobiota bacterium]
MDNRHILELLDDAESALRENLHRHDLDPTARAHMERAVSHTQEAYIATNEIGKARTVQRLIGDLDKADRLIAKLRGLRSRGGVVKPIRI